jgi:hypothetical protein
MIFVPDCFEYKLTAEEHVVAKALLNFVQAQGKLFESAIQKVVQNVSRFGISFH